MAYLKLHRKLTFKAGIPLWVFVNERPIGIMRGKNVTIEMPEGNYNLSVRIIFQIWKWQFHIGGDRRITIKYGETKSLTINDRERWWNFLFDIDLVFWMIRFFYTFPSPWSMVYEIVSNGFFIIWILRIWMIRDRYFRIE